MKIILTIFPSKSGGRTLRRNMTENFSDNAVMLPGTELFLGDFTNGPEIEGLPTAKKRLQTTYKIAVIIRDHQNQCKRHHQQSKNL